VLIVEAPQKSGALITARFALDQDRDIWTASAGVEQVSAAWPGPEQGRLFGAFDKRGTSKLAEDGAGIIITATDILGAWNIKPLEEGQSAKPEQSLTCGPALAASLAASLGVRLY